METSHRLLLVEDDASLATWIQEFLQQKGFAVHHLNRGDQVLPYLQRHSVDAVLLDLMLPGMHGLEVCRQIKRLYTMPVLMLTAQSEEVDEIVGFEVGAQDYLTKPIRPRILLARLQAALRAPQAVATEPTTANRLEFGQLKICNATRQVMLEQQAIPLTSSEFALLWHLAEHAGQVCSRDQVFLALKGREHDGLDRRLDVMISVLRRKLADDARDPKRIKTVWGRGYLFAPEHWN